MDQLLKLTILHSNDIHGDFLPTVRDGVETGGMSRLSGYVHQVRREEERVIYAIAGDMFMGSVIDQEYKGLSTIGLVNVLEPDMFAIGNHEVDYGLSHLMFLEKCSDCPIMCANMVVKELDRPLLRPYIDVECKGLTVRFIALITDSIIDRVRQEDIIGNAVGIRSYLSAVGTVCRTAPRDRVDLTVLLTHIGIEEDKILAASLTYDHGVDLIIGGHSHTLMEEPLIVNGIPIVQAGVGSSHIGRFDLTVDRENKRIADWSWRTVRIDENTAGEDPLMVFYLENLEAKTRAKYNETVVTFPCVYTHNGFHRETQLLDLFADIYRDAFHTDVFLLPSNVIRCKKLGPVVTRNDLADAYPYENAVYSLTISGAQLEGIIRHIYRKNAWLGTSVFFLFSGSLSVDYDKDASEVTAIRFLGRILDTDRIYTLGITTYAYKNMESFLGSSKQDLEKHGRITRLSSNDHETLETYFASHNHIYLEQEGRLHIHQKNSPDA